MAKPKTIFVKSATNDRSVALSEAHEEHPNGEAWVVGYPGEENVVEVGLTPLVRQKLADGVLIEFDKPLMRSTTPEETPKGSAPEKK